MCIICHKSSFTCLGLLGSYDPKIEFFIRLDNILNILIIYGKASTVHHMSKKSTFSYLSYKCEIRARSVACFFFHFSTSPVQNSSNSGIPKRVVS